MSIKFTGGFRQLSNLKVRKLRFVNIGITEGMVAYYPLIDDADDYTDNNYHGVVYGAQLVPGGFDGNGAYRFNGVSDYIATPGMPLTTTSSFTLTAWYNWFGGGGGSDGRNYILQNNSNNGNNYPFTLELFPEGGTIGTWRHGTSGSAHIRGGVLSTNEWSMITVTVDMAMNQTILYQNDAVVATNTQSFGNHLDPGSGFNIGTYRFADDRWMDGDICNVKIFNRVLSSEEITIEYNRR